MEKFIFILITQICALQSYCQTDIIREKLDSIFQYVDKSQVTTGYLKEYGAEMTPLHWFNGVLTDSNFIANTDVFRFIYDDLATSKIQTALPSMPDMSVVNSSIDSLRQGSSVPVAILYGNYGNIREDAITQNLLYISNNQVYDIFGRSQSPYLSNVLFAASPIREKFTDTVRLSFFPSLYYTNTSNIISSL